MRGSESLDYLEDFIEKPMITKAFVSVASALVLFLATASPALAAQVSGMHLSATDAAAQLTLDLTDTVNSRLFSLKTPDRAVIDLSDTRLAGGVHEPQSSGVVTAVRTGVQAGGTLRVVLQLSSQLPVHSTWGDPLPGGGRQLIITVGEIAVGEPTPARDAAPRTVAAAHAPAEVRDIIVAVDAGHGGSDPGALGHHGTKEKDVTLAIARKLAERIDTEPGMHAVLTRSSDEFVILRDRIRRARVAKADMFISVHADSAANREASGASVYILSERGASSEAARWLAERENAADLMGGVKLDDKDSTLASVLLDLSQSANISASMVAADRVLGSLDEVGAVRKSEVQQAGFVVLKSPDIPSMLVETAYISNPREELKLRSVHEQERLAEAIFAGVRSYFQSCHCAQRDQAARLTPPASATAEPDQARADP